MSNDYLKLYHLNGRRVKVASGSWPQIKSAHIPPLKHSDESYELVGYIGGSNFKFASGDWDAIRSKMEGAGQYVRKKMNADCSDLMILAFGLTAWIALVQIVLGV